MRNVAVFFHGFPFAMYAMKTVKMVKPMREYMPAQAMSMAKVRGGSLVFWRVMTGVPYCSVKVTGRPMVFRMVCAACELIVERLLPRV